MVRTASSVIAILLFSGLFAFAFPVQLVKAQSDTIHINSDGNITPSTANITTSDNITYTFSGNIIDQCIVVEKDNIVIDGAGYTLQRITPSSEIGIDLRGRNDVLIKNTRINNFGSGISLDSSFDNSISANYVVDSGDGILLNSSSHNRISDNSITENGDGIKLNSDSSNNVSGNILSDNSYGDIVLYSSSNDSFSGNKLVNLSHNIVKNTYGFFVSSSSHNSISGNSIMDIQIGITLGSSSNSNVISDNNITNNNFGISLEGASNNSIYHNTFSAPPTQYGVTTQPVWWDSKESGLVNVWDDGSKGNYWSDYNGTDANGDGIGDTPYVIAPNNVDQYPLMAPYVVPEFEFLIMPSIFMIMTLFATITLKSRRNACVH